MCILLSTWGVFARLAVCQLGGTDSTSQRVRVARELFPHKSAGSRLAAGVIGSDNPHFGFAGRRSTRHRIPKEYFPRRASCTLSLCPTVQINSHPALAIS